MQAKIFIYCLFGALVCSGCSSLHLVAQIEFPKGAKLPQAGNVSGFPDSLKTKNQNVQDDSMRAPIDSIRVVAFASDLEAESHFPNGARTKLVPFREKSKIVWTSVAVGALGGMVIGTIIGSVNKPDYPSLEHRWAYMFYGSAIGSLTGAFVGVIVAAGDGVLLLSDDTFEEH